MAALNKITLVIGLILIMVGSYAVYTNYTESQLSKYGIGQTKAWIFGSGPYSGIFAFAMPSPPIYNIQATRNELANYPTLKAYIDYIDSTPNQKPHSSKSIDLSEARSFLLFFSQKAGYDIKPLPDSFEGEMYNFHITIGETRYEINIFFNNNQPVLD